MKRSLWPTRDPVKDYFPLPKEIFSLGLSAAEIAIYAYLLFCEDRQTFKCWPSYRKISEAVGLSPNTICKHIRSLEERGLLVTEPTMVTTKDGCKRNGNRSSPSDRFKRRFSRTMTGRCRSLPRTQQGGNMLILLRTQVDRTDKTPVTARRARVGGLCGFRSSAERVPIQQQKTGRYADVREHCGHGKRRKRTAAGGFQQREKPQAAKQPAMDLSRDKNAEEMKWSPLEMGAAMQAHGA